MMVRGWIQAEASVRQWEWEWVLGSEWVWRSRWSMASEKMMG